MHTHKHTEKTHRHHHCLKPKVLMILILVHVGQSSTDSRIRELCPLYLDQEVVDRVLRK